MYPTPKTYVVPNALVEGRDTCSDTSLRYAAIARHTHLNCGDSSRYTRVVQCQDPYCHCDSHVTTLSLGESVIEPLDIVFRDRTNTHYGVDGCKTVATLRFADWCARGLPTGTSVEDPVTARGILPVVSNVRRISCGRLPSLHASACGRLLDAVVRQMTAPGVSAGTRELRAHHALKSSEDARVVRGRGG